MVPRFFIWTILAISFGISSSEGAIPPIVDSILSKVPYNEVVQGSPSVETPKASRFWVLVFMSSHCPCSTAHTDHLQLLQRRFNSYGVSFIGVHSNQSENPDHAKDHFIKLNLSFPIYRDFDGRWARKLGALKTPHAFVLDENGEVIYSGGVTNSSDPNQAKRFFLKNALKQIAKGADPNPKHTRSLGCRIDF